jgi:DNA-binding protein H-NS
MSEALKALNNIRTLRAHARETDLATLEDAGKLTAIVEDRREEESAIREQEERQKGWAFRQKLLDDGIDPAELLAAVGSSQPKAKSTRTPRPNTTIQMKTVMSRLDGSGPYSSNRCY